MTINEIAERLKKLNSVLIFCHTRSDGDTLGGAFALKKTFRKLGMIAEVTCDSVIPEKFSFMGFNEEILSENDLKKPFDAFVAVDCSTEGMIGERYKLFASKTETYNIDHHISNTRYAKYNYVEDRSACSEIVYELITAMGAKIEKETANCLFLGISTDTGHFMHSNVTDKTFKIASELVSFGADSHEIGVKMFKTQSKARAELQSYVTSGMKFYEDDKIALIMITKADLEKFGATSDLTEGFIDYPLSVSGVEVAVSILESNNNAYKISLRSKGKVNVNEVASSFGGGGHILASGCMIFGFYEDVKDKIIRAVSLAL